MEANKWGWEANYGRQFLLPLLSQEGPSCLQKKKKGSLSAKYTFTILTSPYFLHSASCWTEVWKLFLCAVVPLVCGVQCICVQVKNKSSGSESVMSLVYSKCILSLRHLRGLSNWSKITQLLGRRVRFRTSSRWLQVCSVVPCLM